ncbi:adenine phosphoribosyltransferase [Edaphobacillus lindanitolerans]|uniref:Adenine phosphoribosyltransferase n=2 Tax=Edaphobacillus lindanitolerans TaxID=550447 RepID=A0A1U7PMV6_9BACI|nr:adenine phosphoribosyltransferase [Edaphobacillus lindanitolerans]
MKEKETYMLKIGNIIRELPIIQVSEDLKIASFVVLGDTEVATDSAAIISEKLPEADFLVTAEAKGIPFVHEVAKNLGMPRYIVARKTLKAYMDRPLEKTVRSITTQKEQTLILDGPDADLIKGKRVILIDDVISTGESIRALEELVADAGAEVVARAAILAEGDAAEREDLIFLGKLPLFPIEQ